MRLLGYFFGALTYIGAGGILLLLFLATALHVYRKGILPFLFGLSFDEIEIVLTVLAQPLTWILAAVTVIGFGGLRWIDRRSSPDVRS